MAAYGLLNFLVLSRPIPTGDALTDKLNLAQRCLSHKLRRGKLPEPGVARVSLEELDSWRPEFDMDPRYWQLRRWSLGITPSTNRQGIEQLQAGLALGAIDEAGLLALAAGLRGAGASNDEELQVVLRELVSRFPDSAAGHYLTGAYALEHGNLDEAQQSFEAGNTAKHCGVLYSFPVSLLPLGLKPDQPYPGYLSIDIIICHDEALAGTTQTLSGVMLASVSELGSRRELYAAIHECACRVGAGLNLTDISGISARTTCGVLAKLAREGDLYSEPADKLALESLWQVLRRLDQSTSDVLRSRLLVDQEENGLPLWTYRLDLLNLHGRSVNQRVVREVMAKREMDAARAQPFLEALSSFDYRHPAVTAQMQCILDTVPDKYPEENESRNAGAGAAAAKTSPNKDGMPQVPTTTR